MTKENVILCVFPSSTVFIALQNHCCPCLCVFFYHYSFCFRFTWSAGVAISLPCGREGSQRWNRTVWAQAASAVEGLLLGCLSWMNNNILRVLRSLWGKLQFLEEYGGCSLMFVFKTKLMDLKVFVTQPTWSDNCRDECINCQSSHCMLDVEKGVNSTPRTFNVTNMLLSYQCKI